MRAIFFSSVAHELRTPLNSIIPMIRMILDTMSHTIDSRVQNYLQIILNAALHLQNVIEDALDMSRLENNKFSIYKEMSSIKRAVEEVCSLMNFQLNSKGLKLDLDISPQVPSQALIDLKRYKQVLFNLMGNASKFTFKGGISLKIEFQHNNLISSVKDTGIGIKKEDLNKLFRFFGCIAKSKDINRGGMGLGLTISKMIIQQLDGSINVESLPSQGSNFTFRIPITEYFYEAEGASPNVS